MNWIIPGTTLEGQRENADRTNELFQSMFLAGGLTLSQVSSITGLESYTIQNWVKRGFLPPPQNKRYNIEQDHSHQYAQGRAAPGANLPPDQLH